jgi:hypothetical protein
MAFFDDDHLVTVDSAGGLRMIDVTTDRVVAEGDAAGPILALEAETSTRLVRVQRQSGETTVFEVAGDRFQAHLIVDGSNQSGLLPAGRDDEAVVWTRDPAAALRRYTRPDLAAGRVVAPVPTSGPPVAEQVVAIDRRGARYVLVGAASGIQIERLTGEKEKQVAQAVDPNVYMVIPSPTGDLVAVTSTTGVIAVYRAEDMKRVWVQRFVSAVMPVWSADGRRLELSTTQGMIVFDAATGDRAFAQCGGDFVARVTPPLDPNGSIGQVSVCEP